MPESINIDSQKNAESIIYFILIDFIFTKVKKASNYKNVMSRQ